MSLIIFFETDAEALSSAWEMPSIVRAACNRNAGTGSLAGTASTPVGSIGSGFA
jgi:hypothetical protein